MSTTQRNFHAFEVYSEQLYPRGFGMPLWEPEPAERGEVEIGDVGYLQKGGFYRLFNATRERGDPLNTRLGCPETFEPFVLDPTLCYKFPNAISSGAVCSESITHLEGGSSMTVGGSNMGLSFRFEGDKGALLHLPELATRMEAHSRELMEEYMAKNYEEWCRFASKKGLGHMSKEIIFVCGWLKARKWTVAAFSDSKRVVDFSLLVGAGSANVSAKLSFTERSAGFFDHRDWLVPLHNLTIQSRLTEGDDLDSSEEPACDQCIFVSYYRMKYRLLQSLKVTKAARGPHELPGPPDADEAHQVLSGDTTDSQTSDIESIPLPFQVHDPVEDILDYIIDNSPATCAVSSCDDAYALLKELKLRNFVGFAAEISTALSVRRIEVNASGVDMLKFPSEELDTFPSPTITRSPLGPSEIKMSVFTPPASPMANMLPSSASQTRSSPRMYWKKELNNLCATTGARETWDLQAVGPDDQQVWYATVYINGVQCGYGTGNAKKAAQESAAQQAYHTLTNTRR